MKVSPPKATYMMHTNLSCEAGKVGLFHRPGVILVFFDTETTGVDKVKNEETGRWVTKKDPLTGRTILDEPTEVSAQKYRVTESGSLELIEELEVYIKPSIPVPPDVEEITGITNEFLADKPNWADVHTQIRDFFANHIVIAHNAPFDVKMMDRMYTRMNDCFKPDGVMDTLAICRYLFPEAESRKLKSMIEMLQLQYKVDYLCEDGVDYHNSTYDVVALRVLYEALVDRIPEALRGKRTVPYISGAYYEPGKNHFMPSTVFITNLGKIKYNHTMNKWMSNDAALYHIDMGAFEKLALDFTRSYDLQQMKEYGKKEKTQAV